MTEKLPKLAVELAKQGRALDAARDAHREDLRSLQRCAKDGREVDGCSCGGDPSGAGRKPSTPLPRHWRWCHFYLYRRIGEMLERVGKEEP